MFLFIVRNYDAEIYAFGKRLGEEFDAATLKRAFITRFVSCVFSGGSDHQLLTCNTCILIVIDLSQICVFISALFV